MDKKNFCVPKQMWDRLKAIADAKGIAVAELIRRVLDEWLEMIDKCGK